MLSKYELQRYERQIDIAGFGEEGQQKLKNARVVIAGVGGLGSPIAIYLAAAGVGKIRLIDRDSVDLGNLNRQILYNEEDIGELKVASARAKLESFNSTIEIEAISKTIIEDNVFELVGNYDLIVDAMDNFPARRLLNRIAISRGIPLFHGAIHGFEGTATSIIPGSTPCLACLYKQDPLQKGPPVVGVAPAVIGSIQATEVIKYIVGIGELLTNRLLIYDGLSLEFMELAIARDPDCQECKHLRSK
ncbi:Sulfur carrier protein adenylyltransferase [subsurface metagenome]